MRALLAGAVLAAAFALPAAPGAQPAPAPDLCGGREGCTQGDIVQAGRDAGRVRLRVGRASVPSPLDEDAQPLCTSDLDEYWLLRGTQPARLVAHVCDGVGISEGIEVTIGDNRITTAFLGGSGVFRTSYSTTYQLSPLRLRSVEVCRFSTGDYPRWVQTRIDVATLRGEALAFADPPAEGEMGAEFGCEPSEARQRWLVIPRLTVDVEPMARLGYGLGDCSAAMAAQRGGYVLSGRPGAGPEIRLLATGPRSLLVQIAGDLGAAAPAGAPLGRRSRLEVWTADLSHLSVSREDEGSARQLLIDPVSGERAMGEGGGDPPEIARWQTTLPDGRLARLLHITYPPGPIDDLPLQLTVVHVDAPGGRERRRTATSRFILGRASTLGETLDVAGFTRCAVVGGVLQITEPGVVQAPFEAHRAAGLR